MEFKNLKRVAKEEVEKLDAAYANKSEFTDKDAELYKCLMSGLKDQLAVEGMMNAGEYEEGGDEPEGMSGRRGRAMNGRFVSRDGGQSYADGYSQGYNEGMRQARENEAVMHRSSMSYDDGYSRGYNEGMRQSGHYPMYPGPRYPY